MFYILKVKVAGIGFVKRVLENPVDLQAFREKPSFRFIAGLSFIGFSYLIAWPLIALLGILAIYFKKPLLFAVGSPVCYGISHLIFLLGAFIAGKDTVMYMNTFLRWSLSKLFHKMLGQKAIRQSLDMDQNGVDI